VQAGFFVAWMEVEAMFAKLAEVESRYEQLNQLMTQPEVISDLPRLHACAQEQSALAGIVEKYRAYRNVGHELEQTEAMLKSGLDDEMRDLAKEEMNSLKQQRETLAAELKVLLLPTDPNDEKSVIVEVRAGAGGDEAGLFAADLYRMYARYAETRRWTIEVMNSNENSAGGFKEIIFEVKGRGAYSRLKYESGVHRVQRVPTTESGGRIHTSTATVIVLPEVEDVEVEINPDDLTVEVYRSGGHGGQSVNTTDSAVRIIHNPTGIVVTCQDERSQLKNKTRAMSVLRARLYDAEQRKQQEASGAARRLQVGTGDRSEKIRTYNFPQDRITDHRIGLTVHGMPAILNGALDDLIDATATADQAERLQASGIENGE
jgi:peptide chain release factor 1